MFPRSVVIPRVLSAVLFIVGGSAAGVGQTPPRGRISHIPEPAAYFPLAVGNSWTYAVRGAIAGQPVTMQVTQSVEIGSREYFVLEGFAAESALVRLTRENQLVQYDRESGRERLWYDFAAPRGASWRAQLPGDCIGVATIAAREIRVEVLAGHFGNALQIQYGPTNCADAGLEEEVFAPGVGLVRRTEVTIAGPRALVLTEARLGPRTFSERGVSFELSIDQPVYSSNQMPPVDPERAIPVLKARMTIRNSTGSPLQLTFSSGQLFDLLIRNEQGDVVFRWSAGRSFTQALMTLDLSPGERTFMAEAPLQAADGGPLPPGSYTAEGLLTPMDPVIYGATVSFQVGEPVF